MTGAQGILKNIESWSGVRERDPAGPWKFWNHEADRNRANYITSVVEGFYPNNINICAIKTLADYDENLKELYAGTFQGKYRVEPENGPSFIVHIKKSVDRQHLTLGAGVFDHLRRGGINATDIIRTKDGALVCEDGGYVLYFTRFMKGRHLFAVPAELQALGHTMGLMGNIMRTLPDDLKTAIQENSQKNLSFMAEGYGFIENNHGFFRDHFPDIADDLRHTSARTCAVPAGQYAPAHYDPIEKNLIFDGQRVCVLDFDRTGDSWSPWYMDAGVAFARAVLNSPIDAASAGVLPLVNRGLITPFLDGYNETTNRPLGAQDMADAGLEGAASRIAIISAYMARGDWSAEKGLNMLREFCGYFRRVREAALVLSGR